MVEDNRKLIFISEPGLLALGAGLPSGPIVQSYFQDDPVVQVACGKTFSAVVCASGKVYTFGKMKNIAFSEIGTVTVTEPRLVASLGSVRVTQVACGGKFIVFLTDRGLLYSWGNYASAQLGLGHTDNVTSPSLVTGLPPIKKVAAGRKHTVALDFRGDIWVAGSNKCGQLGYSVYCKTSFTWVPHLPKSVIDISCGSYYTALLLESEVLLVTGSNENGQLGIDESTASFKFKPVFKPEPAVAAMSCGEQHTVALCSDGTILSWGDNGFGQLGTGSTTKRSSPMQMIGLENHTITKVIAGRSHTALLTTEGDVLVCGRGRDGELGQGKGDLLVPTLISKSSGLVIQQVAFAETYSLILVIPKSTITPTPQLQCGVTLQISRERGCVTNLERTLIKSLKCLVCLKIMSAPIHLCVTGHSLCNACRCHMGNTVCPLCHEAFISVRNISLERLSTSILLPCVECLQRMPICLLEKHGEVCLKRQYTCPVQQSCGWTGLPRTVLRHTLSVHSDQIWQDLPHLFVHSTSDELLHTNFLLAHNHLFTLHWRFNKMTGEFRASVRFFGNPKEKCNFRWEITFIMDNDERIFRRNICADFEGIEDTLLSPNCVSMKGRSVDTFLQDGCLVCQVDILNSGTSSSSYRIQALLRKCPPLNLP